MNPSPSIIEIIVIGHGSRVRQTTQKFDAFMVDFQKYWNNYIKSKINLSKDKSNFLYHSPVSISWGYIECSKPTMKTACELAASGPEKKLIIIVPLLLFRSGHAKTDLPLILSECRESFAGKGHDWKICDVLGFSPMIREISNYWIEKELYSKRKSNGIKSIGSEGTKKNDLSNISLIVWGRGSSDPDANGDFFKVLRLINEAFPEIKCLPAFAGISKPDLIEAVEHAVLTRPNKIFILPFLLFPGILTQRMQQMIEQISPRYPWIQFTSLPMLSSRPDLLFRAIVKKIETVLEHPDKEAASAALLPCENCQYRTPFRGKENQVSGMKALLYSIRHSFTHTQATPDQDGLQHKHSQVKRHILVCSNVNCNEEGSRNIIHFFKRLTRESDLQDKILISTTSCLGLCGNGPNVIVYPDGIWYQKVTESVALKILKEHIGQDKLVKDHIFTIMD